MKKSSSKEGLEFSIRNIFPDSNSPNKLDKGIKIQLNAVENSK